MKPIYLTIALVFLGSCNFQESKPCKMELEFYSRTYHESEDVRFYRDELKIKNYNDLRVTDILAPRLLIVVVVPDQVTDWLAQSDNEARIKYCGYWQSMRGMGDTQNTSTVSISIPRSHRLDADSLTDLMQRIASGETP